MVPWCGLLSSSGFACKSNLNNSDDPFILDLNQSFFEWLVDVYSNTFIDVDDLVKIRDFPADDLGDP